MNLQKSFGVLSIDGKVVSYYAGFYSLKSLASIVKSSTGKDVSLHKLQRSDAFLALLKLQLGIDLQRTDKIAAVLKEKGLYLRVKNDVYCDIRLFMIFYVLSCEEAMSDCMSKAFGL